MKKILCILLLLPTLCWGQSETHVFTTYDTTLTIGGYEWIAAITRPTGLFGNGPDTASRPLIIMMPGIGQMGSTNYANLTQYGPHYWLANGWDGGVQLGNGKHYPIYISVTAVTNTYPSAYYYYQVVKYFVENYHIKPGCVYGTGLSEGSITNGSLIEYEQTIGDHAGMQLMKALVCLEGTPQSSYYSSPSWATPYPKNTWADTPYFATWARIYGGRLFYLEGSGADNFRDGWHYAVEMNGAVPGSAYFSYEDAGGGAHCCWNTMYDPSQTNWSCVGALGPYNSPSQLGTNTMGDYTGGNVYQWMLRQGDTSLVGSAPAAPAPVNTGFFAFIPTASQRIHAGDSVQVVATLVTDNQVDTINWIGSITPVSSLFTRIGSTAYSSFWLSGLTTGTYTFSAIGTSASGGIGSVTDTITVVPAVVCPVCPVPRTVTAILVSIFGTTFYVPTGQGTKISLSDGTTQSY